MEQQIQVKETRFVCPNCKDNRGFFGTFTYDERLGKHPESPYHGSGYKTGDRIGYCKVHHHEKTSCRYRWLRSAETDAKHFQLVDI